MQLKSMIRVGAVLTVVLLLSGLAVLSLAQQRTIAGLRTRQRMLEQSLKDWESFRVASRPAAATQGNETELARLRENTKDLLRLRNEVTQLRKQLEELEKLRAANAELLQAVQGSRALQSNQMAMVTSARKKGAILGVTIQAAEPGRAGVVVTGVDPTSPVAGSGLIAGDLIFALDGKPVQTPGQLQAEMLTRNPGEIVTVDVLRTNTTLRFNVQTRAWPQ